MTLTGLAVGIPAGIVMTAVWFAVSVPAGVSAAAGAAGALVFAAVGHLVQWVCADRSPGVQLAAALASYGARVGLFAVALALYLSLGSTTRLHPAALVGGCAAVALASLVAEVVAGSRMRVLSFDDPEPEEGTR